MSIIQWTDTRKTTRRTANRTAYRPKVDGLEERTVLSVSSMAGVAVQAPTGGFGHAAQTLNLNLSNLDITKLTTTTLNQLVATGTATLSLAGHTINDVPITLTATQPTTQGATPILHLSLGPVNLSLLGLNVKLDNCAGGPITVDLKAIPSTQPGGGLLGDLLIDVANLLNGPIGTGTAGSLTSLLNTSTISGALNSVLGSVSSALSSATAAAAGTSTSQILDLHLNPINLDLLGAQVTTSAICLDISATQGPGNLLGNLLGGISHLLDTSGTNGVGGLLQSVFRVLQNAPVV